MSEADRLARAMDHSDVLASHRYIRRKGFPIHRPDEECYCDTCWSYLSEDAGGDPERAALAASPAPDPGAGLRTALRDAIGYTDEENGLEHWHFARGGRTSPDERAGVFVDRGQVLDAIDRVLR